MRSIAPKMVVNQIRFRMIQVSDAAYIEILSSTAQIFGALLGLLGLTMVRLTETAQHNFSELLGGMVKKLTEIILKIEGKSSAEMDLHVDTMEGMLALVEKYKPLMKPFDYENLKRQHQSILDELADMRKTARKFKINCWLSCVLILLAVLGLFLPPTGGSQIYLIVIAGMGAVTLIQAVLFFLMAAHSRFVFIFDQ